MSCNSPNLMLKVKVDNFGLNFLKSKKFLVDKNQEFAFKYLGSSKNFPDYDLKNFNIKYNGELVPVPCGRCIACRLDYSKNWALRCICEASKYEYNYFVTLTYDDEHLPRNDLGNPTLRPDDLSKFMKILRQFFKRKYNFEGIRFLGCGEYGEKYLRPHLHLLLFNCPLKDLTNRIPYVDENGEFQIIYKKDIEGNPLYYSDDIHFCWDKGNVIIGRVTFRSAGYVARYICKKQFGDGADFYKIFDLKPEFLRCSNRPGIGADYLDSRYEEIYSSDKLYFVNGDKAVYSKPPRYFDKRLENIDDHLFGSVKSSRLIKAKNASLLEASNSSFNVIERNVRSEENLSSLLSSLKRL